MQGKDALMYGGLAVLNAILTQFAVELGKGSVPIPAHWAWVIPILGAGLVTLTMLLPRLGPDRTVRTTEVTEMAVPHPGAERTTRTVEVTEKNGTNPPAPTEPLPPRG